jgi:DNA-binding response OmpR family regulator
MMPVMDGYELCQKLKTDEKTSHIPVILLTARADMDSKIEGLETGADDFISKPFEQEELLVRIKNLIIQRSKLKERFMTNAAQIGLKELLQMPETGIGSMEQQFMLKAVNIVSENLPDPEFSVRLFADTMNMSRMQLHRKLVALTGQPAQVFIRTLRLKKAASLLAQKRGNVTEVAYEVGFNNLSYFARCFKDEYGISPSEYISRKQ